MFTIQVSAKAKKRIPHDIISPLMDELRRLFRDESCAQHAAENVVMILNGTETGNLQYEIIGACRNHEKNIDTIVTRKLGKYKLEKI